MKNLPILVSGIVLFASCNSGNTNSETTTKDSVPAPVDTSTIVADTPKFDINNLSVTNTDIGSFPFFTLPKGLKSQNKPFEKDFDVCFFPIDGIMTPIDGKLYKVNVVSDGTQEYSQRYFEKSLEDYLTSIGATKIFDGTITQEEYDRYSKEDPNKGDDGDIGYTRENIKVYAIRTADKGNVYVQFSSDNASGKLNILQEESLKQTITKVTADQIAADLTAKGKSILYINFDIDKSNLTSDGKELVAQISKALSTDKSLNITIEGHTDNTGDASHNKKLSNERANAVMKELVSSGIDKARLTAKGFGAERPLVANDSEENKAKNRRVELIKVK